MGTAPVADLRSRMGCVLWALGGRMVEFVQFVGYKFGDVIVEVSVLSVIPS